MIFLTHEEAASHCAEDEQPISLYDAPAAPSQEPLTDEQIDAAAKQMAKDLDYPWDHMTRSGRENMRAAAKSIVEAAHGITQPGGGAE